MTDLSNSNLEKLLAEATKGPWVMVPWHIEEGPSAVRKADSSEYVCNTASDATASLIALTPDLAAEVLAQRELFAFVANDPCFKLLGTVTQDRVSAALDHQDHSS